MQNLALSWISGFHEQVAERRYTQVFLNLMRVSDKPRIYPPHPTRSGEGIKTRVNLMDVEEGC